jgi:hypothetical protein
MSTSKAMRYAMIRRAVMNVQKAQHKSKVIKSNLLLAKEVEAIDREDYKSNIRWRDTDKFVNYHFNDVYQANNKDEEWN